MKVAVAGVGIIAVCGIVGLLIRRPAAPTCDASVASFSSSDGSAAAEISSNENVTKTASGEASLEAGAESGKLSRPSRSSYTPSRAVPGKHSPLVSRRASSPVERASARKLLAKDDAAAREELARVHAKAGSDVRRLIELQALKNKKDSALKKELSGQAAAVLGNKEAKDEARAAALETLRFLAAPEAKEKALALLEKEPPPELAAKAIAYLGRVNAHEAFGRVFALAQRSSNVSVKAVAIRNLTVVGGQKHPKKVVALIESALSDPNQRIQAEALRILGHFPDEITPSIRRRVEGLAKGGGSQKEPDLVGTSARMLVEQLRMTARKPVRATGRR